MAKKLLPSHIDMQSANARIGKYAQEYSTDDIPAGISTRHNFHDGRGPVLAYPLDSASDDSSVCNVDGITSLEGAVDNGSDISVISDVQEKTVLVGAEDSAGSASGLQGVTYEPVPIVLRTVIAAEIADKVKNITPVQTQAIPGGDITFRVNYMPGYSYVPGDLTLTYGRLSADGRTITISADEDLTTTLMLSPSPQGWDSGKPNPAAKQEETDRQLGVIPIDGTKTHGEVRGASLETWFNVIQYRSTATSIVTNITSGTSPSTPTGTTYDLTVNYAKGYDNNDVKIVSSDPDVTFSYDRHEDIYPDVTLPSQYRKLQYVYGGGNTYIDTGVKLKGNDKVEIVANVSQTSAASYQVLFGARTESGGNRCYAIWTRYNGSDRLYYGRANSAGGYTFTYGSRIRIVCNCASIAWYNTSGTQLGSGNASYRNEDTEYNCYLFGLNTAGTLTDNYATAYIYRFTVYSADGSRRHDFIPAYNRSNGCAGLYDIVGESFVTDSAGALSYVMSGEYNYRLLHLGNITQDMTLTFSPADAYANPVKIGMDNAETGGGDIAETSLCDYFWTVGMSNKCSSYATSNSGMNTPRVGSDTSFILTYTEGYDLYDVTASSSRADTVLENTPSVRIPEYHAGISTVVEPRLGEDGIGYNEGELAYMYTTPELPEEYTVIAGVKNADYNTYFRTGYIPAAGDTITCYASVTANTSYAYNILFGARNSEGNASCCFFTRYNSSNVYRYDRCGISGSVSGIYTYPVKITCSPTAAEIDGGWQNLTLETGKAGGSCTRELFVFNHNSNGSYQSSWSAYATIYRFWVYGEGGKKKMDLIPAIRNSDSMVGFYDIVSNKFIVKATGSVSAVRKVTNYSRLAVSSISGDVTVTLSKNENSSIFIPEVGDSLDTGTAKISAALSDYFWTVSYTNPAAAYASMNKNYGTPRLGNTDTMVLTFRNGYDEKDVTITADNGATVDVKERMSVKTWVIPDEYDRLFGVGNSTNTTYFKTGYVPSAGDTVVCYCMPSSGYSSYPCAMFGARTATGSQSLEFISRTTYDGNNSTFAYDRSKYATGTPVYDTLLKVECTPASCSYTTGYSDYAINTSAATVGDCTRDLWIFATNANGSKGNTAYGTIYSLYVKDSDGIVRLALVPAMRKADGVIGFYDYVGAQFIAPAAGSVYASMAPVYKTGVTIGNITRDASVQVAKVEPEHTYSASDAIESDGKLAGVGLNDWFYAIKVVNNAGSAISFSGYTYSNYICQRVGNTASLTPVFSAGYDASSFIVNGASLSNNALTIPVKDSDNTVTISLNDWHDPTATTDDDLGIFAREGIGDMSQYYIYAGDGTMASSYSFISGESSMLVDKGVWSVRTPDLLAFSQVNVPGSISARLVVAPTAMNETISGVTVSGRSMYRHTITFTTQFRMEGGTQYMFKIRSASDTSKLIAVAKDTTGVNIANVDVLPEVTDGIGVFDWNESDKYIIHASMTPYFMINGNKV